MIGSSSPSISPTAQLAAFGRAVESLRRTSDRMVDDPFARLFLGRGQRSLLAAMRAPGAAPLLLSLHERRLPGVLGNLLCRTRFIDETLHEALQDGIQQVVLLGSGFDSRPYRIGPLRRLPIFELDRPQLLAKKRALLESSLGSFPLNVSLIGLDFRAQQLEEVLSTSGFDLNQPAFFVWEGVTQYLARDEIDHVFRFVGSTAPGGLIAFTYIHQSVIDGSNGRGSDAAIKDWVEQTGEPWISGFVPEQLGAYLAARRLGMAAHAGAAEYRERYLKPLGRSLALYEQERVVVARVSKA